MAQEKKDSKYMLRVKMSEKERKQLERMCEMDNGTMSEVVRRAIQQYDIIVHKQYAKRRLAIKSVEKAETPTSASIY